MDRVQFGIKGLDDALNGGIPKGNLVLLSGGAGTGKSTLCLHYLISGALQGERGLFITTEQGVEELSRQAANYSLPFKELVDKSMIKVVYLDILEEEGVLERIRVAVKECTPQRVVIDSLSTFSEYASATDIARDFLLKHGGVAVRSVDQVAPTMMSERTLVKRMLATLINEIKSFNATALLTSELPEKGESLSSDGVSEFLVDGVVLLYRWGIGEVEENAIKIRKMRYTRHFLGILRYSMEDNGFVIKND